MSNQLCFIYIYSNWLDTAATEKLTQKQREESMLQRCKGYFKFRNQKPSKIEFHSKTPYCQTQIGRNTFYVSIQSVDQNGKTIDRY